MKKQNILKDVRSVVEALLIAMVLRSLLVQPFTIPSGSMYPTLMVGDYLYVTKYTYGFSRYSFPFGGYWLPDFGRILPNDPKRGEVVVFRVIDKDQDYIKRIIGLPGDKIKIESGRVYVNDKILPRKRLADSNYKGFKVETYLETLPSGKSYKIWEVGSDDSFSDNTGQYTVPENHYFMLGDNRDQSSDSRFSDVGFVPFDALIGKARHILFSLENASSYEFWKWFSNVRSDRFIKRID